MVKGQAHALSVAHLRYAFEHNVVHDKVGWRVYVIKCKSFIAKLFVLFLVAGTAFAVGGGECLHADVFVWSTGFCTLQQTQRRGQRRQGGEE